MVRTKANSAAATAQATPLDGITIAFADSKTTTIPNNHADLSGKTFAEIKSDIIACGGTYITKVEGSNCTHFVATPEQYAKKLVRVKDAINVGNLYIISYDWLAESLKSQSHVDETQYELHTVAVPASTKVNGTTNSKSVKHARDPDSDSDSASDDEPSPKKSKSAGQKKTRSKVPVDDLYDNKYYCNVYQDDDGLVWDATLNQTAAGKNANKFYRIQLLEHDVGRYSTWTRWGRVGEKGQSAELGDGGLDSALKEFIKKFKDKTGNKWPEDRDQPARSGKYTVVEINYEESDDGELSNASIKSESSDEVQSKLPEPVGRLMSFIFNNEFFNQTLASLDYDATKMPLGKLTKRTLLKGYEVLKELASLIGVANVSAERVEELSDQYFSLIPHAFGRNRPPVLDNNDLIKKEIDLLENLTDMQLANDIMKNAKSDKKIREEKIALADRQYEGLAMQEMTPIDPETIEFKELSDYLLKSAGQTHNIQYKVEDIFRIERQGEFDRFEKSEFASLKKKSDRRLLWHGSRSTNFGGILSQGLRIAPPEAPVSGYMFGKGIYLANMSTKSANYCSSYGSGGVGLLLLCEAELGNPPLKLTDADYNAGERCKEEKRISTWGVGQTAPKGWKDAKCIHPSLKGVRIPDVSTPPGPTNEAGSYLMYDEHIVYDVAQVKLRYLLRVQMN